MDLGDGKEKPLRVWDLGDGKKNPRVWDLGDGKEKPPRVLDLGDDGKYYHGHKSNSLGSWGMIYITWGPGSWTI